MSRNRAPLVVLMGVAGCGKTTVGHAVAQALAAPFVDADDLHPPANKARMAQGLPLEDDHRGPWLDAVHTRMVAAAADPRGIVVACSALKRTYRERLATGLDSLVFVHLEADRSTLVQRLQQRVGHFFPVTLLDSQLATLEPLRGPAGEGIPSSEGIVVDANRPLAAVVTAVIEGLAAHQRLRQTP